MTTVTGIIDRLVRQRLVVRRSDDEDRRIVVCELSVKGRQLIIRLWEQRQARARSLLSKISTADLRLVSAGLEAILNAAKSTETPAIGNTAVSKDEFF
ncbi:MarR family winged helix-turn-helix transcriptional regulator [Chloroflexota bacterium]